MIQCQNYHLGGMNFNLLILCTGKSSAVSVFNKKKLKLTICKHFLQQKVVNLKFKVEIISEIAISLGMSQKCKSYDQTKRATYTLFRVISTYHMSRQLCQQIRRVVYTIKYINRGS